jgi:hypothetical protein
MNAMAQAKSESKTPMRFTVKDVGPAALATAATQNSIVLSRKMSSDYFYLTWSATGSYSSNNRKVWTAAVANGVTLTNKASLLPYYYQIDKTGKITTALTDKNTNINMKGSCVVGYYLGLKIGSIKVNSQTASTEINWSASSYIPSK